MGKTKIWTAEILDLVCRDDESYRLAIRAVSILRSASSQEIAFQANKMVDIMLRDSLSYPVSFEDRLTLATTPEAVNRLRSQAKKKTAKRK